MGTFFMTSAALVSALPINNPANTSVRAIAFLRRREEAGQPSRRRGTPGLVAGQHTEPVPFLTIPVRSEGENSIQAIAKKIEWPDSVLVDLAKRGDKEAFGELAQRHHGKCVRLATSFLKNTGDAEDATQEGISNAFEHIGQYKGEAEFSSWLSRIVANQCLMMLRIRRGVRFVYLDNKGEREDSLSVELSRDGSDPEGDTARGQMEKMIHREIRHIPPRLRNVMVLRDLQELPMMDVAQQLGITVTAAKTRLRRARVELKMRLQPHFAGIGNSDPLSQTAAPLSRLAPRRALRVC